MSNSLELVIKKLFITYDTDNSGALDREELSNLLNDMCQHLGLEECGQRDSTGGLENLLELYHSRAHRASNLLVAHR